MENNGEALINAIVTIDESATLQILDQMITANIDPILIIQYCSKAYGSFGPTISIERDFSSRIDHGSRITEKSDDQIRVF